MKILGFTKRQVIFFTLIVIIFEIGIALRIYGINLRVMFLDEGVHYGFIYDLCKSQPYQYTSIYANEGLEQLNQSLNLYAHFAKLMFEEGSPWLASTDAYKKFIDYPPMLKNLDSIAQSYFYFKHLWNNPGYKYDPVYHGPFIYYLGDLVFNLANDHNFKILRLPMVISSILALFFVFLYREYLGKFGLILSLLLIATSPGLVYFSNLANYEDYIASFTLLGVGLLLLGIRKRSPLILFLSGFTLLTLMSIKETALVVWFCVVLSYILTCIVVYIKNRPSNLIKNIEDIVIGVVEGKYNAVIMRYLIPAILCFAVSGVLFGLLYSSFGSNPNGIHDGLTSWMYWKNTGSQSGHVKPFGYYSEIIINYDFTLIFLFFVGTVITLFTDRNKYKLFICFWALSTWFVYSMIPYKTPWLMINFLLPFAISAGIGWEIIYNMVTKNVYRFITVACVILLLMNAFTTAIKVKWFDYDKESNKLTYVHTYRDFEDEVRALYTLMMASPKQEKTEVTISSIEYWPMPAYFMKKYTSLGYFNGVQGRDLNLNAPIIVSDTQDDSMLRELLLESDVNDFVKLRSFKVRPGVTHTIFVKEWLLKSYIDRGYYKLLIQPGRGDLFEESAGN